jgi:hypothetical protein
MNVCIECPADILSVMKRGLLIAACLALSACGGSGTAGQRPMTQEELSRLAETMYLNHREGKSTFVVVTLDGTGGRRLGLAGTVDWSARSGTARMDADGGGGLVAVAWGVDLVAERRPVHDGLLAGLGYPQGAWISRPVDQRRRVDQVIAVVMGLAATRPENAVLIQQKQGSAFLRSDTLRGQKVEVVRYGERSIYWIDPLTGRMLRFEGNNPAGTMPIIVDFGQELTDPVRPPYAAEVVSAGAHPELAALLDGP